MNKDTDGCELVAMGFMTLAKGFEFFFRALWMAMKIWFAKGMAWLVRPVAVPQWGMLAGAIVLSFGVLSVSHISKMDFLGTEKVLAAGVRVR